MSNRKKIEEELKEIISDTENKENLNIIYVINRKNVFISAIKQFYDNKFQIILGPMIALTGIVLKEYTNANFLAKVLIAIGLFYVIFPYIMLIGNLATVRSQKINMEISKEGLNISDMLTKNNSLSVLGYKDIYDIEKDKYYVRIIPQDRKGKILNAIPIPIDHLQNGNIDEFFRILNSIIKKQGGGKENEENNFTKGKIIFSYTLSKHQYKDIYIKEYYKKKLHIFYIVALGVISLFCIFFNITTAIVCALMCIFYIMYPNIMYKINLKQNVGEVTIRDCGDGYLSIIGENIKVKVKPDKLKVIYNKEYIKYFIPIKKNYFRYIHKEDCDEIQLRRFLKTISYK